MKQKQGRFEGWYYKHQANGTSLALIPGRAAGGAFVQVVTDSQACNISYPLSHFHKGELLRVGGSTFSSSGVTLDIRRPELTLTGEIKYTGITPIRGDVMGLFRFVPMECRHGVISMKHRLSGTVALNGETLDFSGGIGYIESDSGRSFPTKYTWVHCNDFDRDCSVMVSVARIPFCGLRFWGCVCVVWLNGREYRLATYRGVKILRCERGVIELAQGKYRLSVTAEPREGLALPAPDSGAMSRVIRENLSCPARFRFTEGERVLFDGKSDHASYEWVT
ncbi:MAG: hypothetical protein FWG31_08755 [Oscillospiraceae bacterium]|nr:hypothetical protein [Oscillospiraceae bacterium]